jgi:hypothetical protein
MTNLKDFLKLWAILGVVFLGAVAAVLGLFAGFLWLAGYSMLVFAFAFIVFVAAVFAAIIVCRKADG